MKSKYHNAYFMIGAGITAVLVLLALIGCFYTPYDPDVMDLAAKNAGISWQHWMGCDNFGRDIFSRVMEGIRNTFFISVATVGIGTFFGLLIGALTGYFGGILDEVLMRVNDALFSFPSILLALVVVSLLGRGTVNVTLALGIAFIPSFARIIRSEYMKQKSLDYVTSARLMGASHFRIIFVHILPNIVPILLSSIMIGFNNAVLAEAGLSYLGIGIQPPDASLGRMLSEAQSFLFTIPWYAVFPGLMIVLMVLGFSMMSEGLNA